MHVLCTYVYVARDLIHTIVHAHMLEIQPKIHSTLMITQSEYVHIHVLMLIDANHVDVVGKTKSELYPALRHGNLAHAQTCPCVCTSGQQIALRIEGWLGLHDLTR